MPTLSKLSKDAFNTEQAAFEYLEATLLARWRYLPALRRNRPCNQAWRPEW